MASRSRRRWTGRAGQLALALAVAGCSGSRSRHLTQPVPDPGFRATSPASAVRLFEWCWDHRNLDRYRELISDDFLFACAPADSAGGAFPGGALTRFDEIESARHLFVGAGTRPRANSITLQLDQNLVAERDGRPGKGNTTYHQAIVTWYMLRIETDADDFQVTGAARFFLTRGDSALIPADLVALGFRPDSTCWYIERWEDETLGSLASRVAAREGPRAPSLRAQPARKPTWCDIKALYQ